MNRQTTLLGVFIVGALSMSTAAQTGNSGTGTPGQTGSTGQTGNIGQSASSQKGLTLQRGDKLIGLQVQDASGATIGRVDDVVLRADGSIAYAVLSTEGQNTQIPVPWSSLRFDSAGAKAGGVGDDRKPGDPKTGDARNPGAMRSEFTHATLVGVDAARLRTAPHFDRNSWPKDTDRSIWTQSDTFFGARPSEGATGQPGSLTPGAPTSYFRASKLQNQAIVDANDKPIGKLGDLAFDPQGGRVNFAAVSIEDRTGTGAGRTIAMPWESLRASRMDDKDRFQTSTAADRLNGAPVFTTGDDGWRQMSDPTWVNSLYGYYNVRPYWNQSSPPPPMDGSKPKPSTGNPPSGADKPIGKV